MNRFLITLGALVILAGLAWPWLRKLPLFRLPGDIVIDRPGMKLFFPITTMLLLSVVISLILWLLRR
jgi:ribose/xylose/arabinose/galactoside ABC-type transport system permease subunit